MEKFLRNWGLMYAVIIFYNLANAWLLDTLTPLKVLPIVLVYVTGIVWASERLARRPELLWHPLWGPAPVMGTWFWPIWAFVVSVRWIWRTWRAL